MSVTANIETRYRTNVLSVPIQSVTTRLPKAGGPMPCQPTMSPAVSNAGRRQAATNTANAGTNCRHQQPAGAAPAKKPDEAPKPIEVVFVVEGDHVKMVPVKRGISDDNYVEIVED